MQISTAISDGVLAAVAFWCARMALAGGARAGAFGLALIGLAAAAGVLRFSIAPDVLPLHSLLSGIAGQVGVPLVAIAFLASALGRHLTLDREIIIVAVLLILFLLFRYVTLFPLYGTIIGGIAAIAIIAVGLRMLPDSSGIATVLGAIALVVGGIAIGTKGHWVGIPRVDLFHYVTALSVWLLATGLVRSAR